MTLKPDYAAMLRDALAHVFDRHEATLATATTRELDPGALFACEVCGVVTMTPLVYSDHSDHCPGCGARVSSHDPR